MGSACTLPFPSIFIIHELRVRKHAGLRCHQLERLGFKRRCVRRVRRDGPPANRDSSVPAELSQWQSQPMTASEGGISSGTHELEQLSENVIADILEATHAMLVGRLVSWRGRAGLAQRKRSFYSTGSLTFSKMSE